MWGLGDFVEGDGGCFVYCNPVCGDFIVRIRREYGDFSWIGFVVIEVAEFEFREAFEG